MKKEVKITPAMREWCKKLAKPDYRFMSRSGIAVSVNAAFSKWGAEKPPRWTMIQGLMDSGLIEWAEVSGDPYFRYKAVLTEKGKEAAK